MRRILNVIMILGLMITKVQGVEAQENLISTNTNTKNIDNRISDPSKIASVIELNPYDFGIQKSADESLNIYKKEVEEEMKQKQEQKKKVLVAAYKPETKGDFTSLYQTAAS